ncbi:hypothetical protein AOE01nite_13720 [Acetobacter oeni]|uniref:Uncharacterized protein n=1 Tax=Acetobacter oeni TaxID=304077 RepID=A0A511XJP7_9PROT|nr:hypothetical protein AA21952_0190 [Acetobacter oeni LMG 21952]GEN63148.1 hypothetical protein AOE01nite_13720 [Acetobacter oeni]
MVTQLYSCFIRARTVRLCLAHMTNLHAAAGPEILILAEPLFACKRGDPVRQLIP